MTSFRYRPLCFCCVLMLTSFYLHEKSGEVCIKERLGQVTKQKTIKWPITRASSERACLLEVVLSFLERKGVSFPM